MNTNDLMMKASGLLRHAGFILKKHSPKILLTLGVGSVVGGTVKACCDTMKLPAAIDAAKQRVEMARMQDEEKRRKELTHAYIRSGWEIAKIYIPAATLEIAGVSCILASHNILSQRNAALASAYTALDNSFKKYRTRVLERYGEQAEMELRTSAKPVEIEETVVNDKGKEKKVKKTVMVADDSAGYSDYARIFGRGHCRGWEESDHYNDTFLRAQEFVANQKLISQRFLFLNDVYELLGYEPTVTGQQVGWLYDPEDKSDEAGDNYVQFRRYEINIETEYGIEPAIMLDFNVDGLILVKGAEKEIIPR